MAAYSDFQSASNIIDFLTSIDECNIKPTEQEKQVISSAGTLMAIGRFGTGKTICVILRLFAINKMGKYKAQLNNQRSDQMFKHQQINNKLIVLHSLFTTQNLRLVQQVKKKQKQMFENLRQASKELNLNLSQDNQNRISDQIENFENNKLKHMILDELAQEMKKAGYEQEKEVFKFTDYYEEDFLQHKKAIILD